MKLKIVKYKDTSDNILNAVEIFTGDDFSFIYLSPEDDSYSPCIVMATKMGDFFVDYFKNQNSWTNTDKEELIKLRDNLTFLSKSNWQFDDKEYNLFLKLKKKYEN